MLPPKTLKQATSLHVCALGRGLAYIDYVVREKTNHARLDVVGEEAVQPRPGRPELLHERLHPVALADFRSVSPGNHPFQSQEDAPEKHAENLEYHRIGVRV